MLGMTPVITTRETFTRYSYNGDGPTYTGTDGHPYRIELVEITATNFGRVNVVAKGQRMRHDGEPDRRAGPLGDIPMTFAAADELADEIEAYEAVTGNG